MTRSPADAFSNQEATAMSTILRNLNYLTNSAEEMWAVLKHQPDTQLKTALSMLRRERRPIYNRLLSFRFGIGVYPNQGFFKANPGPDADDAYFVSTKQMTLVKSVPLKCVANEDAGYAMAVERLGLAGFLRDEFK